MPVKRQWDRLAAAVCTIRQKEVLPEQTEPLLPDGSVGVLYERGDLDDASKKSERYDEVAFVVVPFTEIRTPLPPAPAGGSTP